VALTDGDNGLRGLSRPFHLDDAASFYYFALAATAASLWLMARFVGSTFGAALRGTRDQPRRMSALGHNVWLIRWISFVYAGSGARCRGCCSCTTTNTFIHLAVAHQFRRRPARGDRRRLGDAGRAGGRRRDRHAPQEYVSAYIERWNTLLGLVFVLIVVFMPDGVVPGVKRLGCASPPEPEKSFGGLPAISDVSLEVAPGERRLIIGPNGAGKTTLFNLVTGDLPRDAGNVALFGEDVTRLAPHHRVHRGLARTYQIITLFRRTAWSTTSRSRCLAFPASAGTLSDRSIKSSMKQARSVLARVGLEHLAKRGIAEVAYGDKRRVEIAMALAQKPRVLLLDEPLAGLSREERATVKQLIAGIPREVTVVMIEHDMDTALDMAERITVLHYGRVIVEGTRAEVVADPKTREVYLGH